MIVVSGHQSLQQSSSGQCQLMCPDTRSEQQLRFYNIASQPAVSPQLELAQ